LDCGATDEAGAVVERLSYDAWGRRRFPDGTDDPSGSITSQTTRGFTGHEELGDVSLVHMNGRVYDPLLGRFGSPDPTTENPFSTQGWNRYSYVGNSPLNFTDPSGYCFLGCFWQPIFKAIGAFFRNIPILGAILKMAAPYFCGPFAPVCAVLASSFVAGVTSGKLGVALRVGLITAVTIGAFHIAGELTGGFPGAPYGGHGPLDAGSEAHLSNIAAHRQAPPSTPQWRETSSIKV
jgi:RHS repeat-associated protein